MKSDRFENSARNLATGLLGRILSILVNFVLRTVFIYCLNEAYLSVNGLYSNILTVLSLAELGFGTAIVYRMYKPMAENETGRLVALLNLYRRIYAIIGFVILLFGLSIVPFMDVIIKDKPNVDGLTLYYILFLVNTVLSYWCGSYMGSLLMADQKEYIKNHIRNIIILIQSTLQIVVLFIFHQYLFYLLVQLIATVVTNIIVVHIVKKQYPEVVCSTPEELSKPEKVQIKKDVFSLFLARIGHVALNGTDNIIISAIVGVLWVGRLSNYLLISDAVASVFTQITAAITGSLGNYFAVEDREKGERLFRRIEFINFWLYAFSVIALITLLDPFIKLWLGEKFVLGLPICVAIAINFYVAGYMNTLWVFRSTLGLFVKGKYRPLIVAGLNIVLSIALGQRWGVFGVLLATFISRAAVNLWYDPWLIYRDGFHKSVRPYFKKYLLRVPFVIAVVCMMLKIRSVFLISDVNLLSFCVLMVVTVIVPNLCIVLLYRKSDEFKFLKRIIWAKIIPFLSKNSP